MTSAAIPAVRVDMGQAEQAAVLRILRSGQVGQGPEVEAFEREFSEMVSGRPCVAVNSGTSALHLALLAAGIGYGDEVIVPSFTFAASANAIAMTGALPVFADIDARTFCLDPAAVTHLIGPRTAAIMTVHLYGQPAHAIALRELAESKQLLLVEDACQAHGARAADRPAGTFGALAAFSFYATKNMTTGEGGMVVCEDDMAARKVRLLRNQGMESRYRHEIVGLNNRMTDVAAAIGRVQLKRLPAWNERRREIAGLYDSALSGLETPYTQPGVLHVYHQYTVRLNERDRVLSALESSGVGAAVYYRTPTHRTEAYRSGGEVLPETDSAAGRVLSLPIRPSLTDNEVALVARAVIDAVEGF